jgi:ligand-binding sensor domain-containing protein
MMRYTNLISALLLSTAILLPFSNAYSQNGEWKTFGYDNYIKEIVIDGNTAWAVSSIGLVEMNLTTLSFNYLTRAQHLELPNTFYSAAIDKYGNKWFGGSNALIKYDGNTFTRYDNQNSPVTGMVMAICSDDSGNIWLGGNGVGGLLKFDGENWIKYIHFSNLPFDYVSALTIAPDGALWIGSYGGAGGGVIRFDGTQFTNYPLPGGTESLIFDKLGKLWVASGGSGLYCYHGNNWTAYTPSNSQLPSIGLLKLTVDTLNNLWIAYRSTPTSTGGVVKFDGTNWIKYDQNNSSLNSSSVLSIGLLSNNNLLLGTDHGIFKKENENFQQIKISDTPRITRIFSLAVSQQDYNLWIGTLDGLYLFDGSRWDSWNTSNSILPTNKITYIFIDKKNRTWVATPNGLVLVDNNSWTLYSSSNSGIPNNDIRHVNEDKAGRIWVSTQGGIAIYNDSTWEVYNSNNKPLPSNFVKQVIFQNSITWIATSGGLVKFDGEAWFTYNTANSALPTNIITTVAGQGDGTVWAGTWGGLTQFKGSSSFNYTTANSGLLDNEIGFLTIEKDSILWIGTMYGGANRVENGIWKAFNTNNTPLAHGSVYSIVIDKNQKWFGTWSSGSGADLALFIEDEPTPIESQTFLPTEFALLQNYPNPFNPSTKIKYQVPRTEFITLKIYDILGNEVTTLVNEAKEPGEYEIDFNGSKLSSGVYFYTLRSGSFYDTKKFILMK